MCKKDKKIVGVCGGKWGKSEVGKTTIVNILSKHLDFYPLSFTDPVKDVARRLFRWNGIMDSGGKILLDDICRTGKKISENYWRDMAIVRIPKDVNKIVFDDVYFDNEFRFIEDNNGLIIKVNKRGFDTPDVLFNTIDVDNNKSIIDLQRTVLAIVNNFLIDN